VSQSAATASPFSDFVVVGAGLVGASVAWGLARAGANVTVFDAGDDRMHASAGNFGLVWVQGKGTTAPDYARLTRRSADAWAAFAEDLAPSDQLQHQQCGGIKIALSNEELSRFATALERHHNNPDFVGNDTRLIDKKELRELVPSIGPDAVGGTWCPHDGHADSLATLQALHKKLERHPHISIVRQRVENVDPSSSTARFILTTMGAQVFTDHVILAAGLGNQALALKLDLQAPIRPERGQILVTERTPAFLDVACHNVRQTGDGTVLLGDSHEDVGLDTGVTQQVTQTILQRAVRTFPHLAQLRLQRTWGALRVLSPDGLPIYQGSKTYPGASLITCHSGVTLAAAHASEVADALLSDRLNETYPSFSADRFENAL
jgi:glycine/D-amino acid oxidase-like deaminating enzyme